MVSGNGKCVRIILYSSDLTSICLVNCCLFVTVRRTVELRTCATFPKNEVDLIFSFSKMTKQRMLRFTLLSWLLLVCSNISKTLASTTTTDEENNSPNRKTVTDLSISQRKSLEKLVDIRNWRTLRSGKSWRRQTVPHILKSTGRFATKKSKKVTRDMVPIQLTYTLWSTIL